MMPAGSLSHLPSSPAAVTVEDTVTVPWERIAGFIGQFSHDVRNGLNALELQLTFLGEISADPEAVDEVKRLRSMLLDVTRLLQTVKTASGPVTPHVLEYPAADLFEDLRERLERLHPENAGKVSWDITSGPETLLLLDPDLTINGLLELFANAFRFGGSSVRCTTVDGPQRVSFILRETPAVAPSIPPERWGREPLLSSHRSAYGLGLFRVRRILETQGGALLAVYSPAENLLTTTADLPRASQAGVH